MKIIGFEETGLSEIARWLDSNPTQDLTETELAELLKTANIFFVLEGINRVQSMLLCELKASYVQQSQRYVSLASQAYLLPELEPEVAATAEKLINRAFDLYQRMSELKEGFSGRPKIENYVHHIPIEDARYILPLATKTNLTVSLPGPKLIDLYKLCQKEHYKETMADFWHSLSAYLPANLIKVLTGFARDKVRITDFFQQYFTEINTEENMVLLAAYKDLDLKVALGALTSTQSRTTTEILQVWGSDSEQKARGVVQRVLGYGHASIAEQARTTFGMMCSLVTYHQQIRHRLPESVREDFRTIITELERPVVIPESIRHSQFAQEFTELVQAFKEFRLEVYKSFGLAKALPLLLNCEQIKMVISTNARIDLEMLAERTCMNAQWEIRNLAIKKLKILRQLSETLYEKALPSCVTGKCREGKLSCGKQKEVRELFQRI
jgi:thymidylate synthase ThyX